MEEAWRKNVANISLIADSPKDSLVSIYWIARIHDLRIREDKTLLSWLENNESLWYTTWESGIIINYLVKI